MSDVPASLAESFAVYVETRRLALDLSRYQIAAAHGIGESTLRAIERGVHSVRLTTFVAVCAALGDNPIDVLAALLPKDEHEPG
jgi:transcriptional regulator with XRE-family HTH domain